MSKRLLHTPDGVMDIYNGQCERKEELLGRLHRQLKLHAFKDIQTPVYEYFDVFNRDNMDLSSKEMYKFIDRDGDTLVLRPDITPSIARATSKYFSDETLPIRFCYQGNTYINYKNYQGKLKEQTQTGAELINDASVNADAEILALAVECLKSSGLSDFQIEVGHSDFFEGIIGDAGLDNETVDKLRELIENKNYFGIQEIVSDKKLTAQQKELFVKLPEMFGSVEILYEAEKLVKSEKSLLALKRLEDIYEILKLYDADGYISFDLGTLSKFDYYTGIIFKAYTYGTGEAVITGGRYDTLLSQFGKNSPAVGLAVLVDTLLSALSRQKHEYRLSADDTLILYDALKTREAIKKANELRNSGINVSLLEKSIFGTDKDMDDKLKKYSERMGISKIIEL